MTSQHHWFNDEVTSTSSIPLKKLEIPEVHVIDHVDAAEYMDDVDHVSSVHAQTSRHLVGEERGDPRMTPAGAPWVAGAGWRAPGCGAARPETYMGLSVVVSVCFNLPLGLLAFLLSLRAARRFEAGDAPAGRAHARCSLLLSMAGLVVTVIVVMAVVFYVASQQRQLRYRYG